MDPLKYPEVQKLIAAALEEDVGGGDATTLATVPAGATARAVLAAREPLTTAGLGIAEQVFRRLSRNIRVERPFRDGQRAAAGDCLLKLHGPARALLTGERTALNFVQRLSGIATLTARFVKAVQGTRSVILDTRKTTPGWRRLEKYAVTCGGGQNHRTGLYDLILIKDNHLAALRNAKPNAVAAAVQRARKKYPRLRIEVEADSLEQAKQAVEAGADFVLLDNMSPARLRKAVRWIAGRAKTEASGGVCLETVRAIAATGVDFISVGALTHSAPAADVALDFEV